MAHQFINIPSGYIWDEKQATEELARVLEAASLGERMPYFAGSRSITDTLKNPDELAANYPMNAANEQIGLAGSTGYKVPGAGGRTLFDILQAGDAMAAGKMAPGFQTSVGQSLTGETPSEINLRGAQAAHLRAQTGEISGQGPAVDQQSKLFKALGTENFDAAMMEALDNRQMKPSEIAMWTQRNAQKIKATTPSDKQLGMISMAKDSYNQIDNLEKAFIATEAGKTGKWSESLKLAMSRMNTGGQAFNEAVERLSPEDRTFVAHANLVQSRLRQLAGAGAMDAHFSNYDAENAARGIGSILTGSKAYREQLRVFKDDIAGRFNNSLNTMNEANKNVKGYGRLAKSTEPKAGEHTLLTPDGRPITVRGPKEAVEKAIADGKYKRSSNY